MPLPPNLDDLDIPDDFDLGILKKSIYLWTDALLFIPNDPVMEFLFGILMDVFLELMRPDIWEDDRPNPLYDFLRDLFYRYEG